MRPDVETDDVEQPVARAFRKPDQRTRERIDFFDGVVVFDGDLVGCGSVEAPMRLAMKFGVSLQSTTPLPSRTSQ